MRRFTQVIIAALTAALALGACCWLLPLVVSAESAWKLVSMSTSITQPV